MAEAYGIKKYSISFYDSKNVWIVDCTSYFSETEVLSAINNFKIIIAYLYIFVAIGYTYTLGTRNYKKLLIRQLLLSAATIFPILVLFITGSPRVIQLC